MTAEDTVFSRRYRVMFLKANLQVPLSLLFVDRVLMLLLLLFSSSSQCRKRESSLKSNHLKSLRRYSTIVGESAVA